ncbi:MAG: hydantoinase/oxoprolinase family protein [Proteobacteria bacterium]|nr:hydantoinase/oxoprolinase family protein [Pseudomonadota bacterium]
MTSLRAALDRAGIAAPVLLMQSNGGLTTSAAATLRPMNIIESGPAGGVVGGQALARRIGLDKIVTFDMGGTTAKASLVESGQFTRAGEYQVGGGIMIGSRLLTGAGYLLKVPAIDLAEVGAGGGSIVWLDAGGSLQIGPESAGAAPGPVCYDQGGTRPTITDANVILGYINPGYLIGGALTLNAERARQVFADTIAARTGLDLADAAYGAHMIAASNMIRAIKAVSTERGRDPRDFALFAFGGNGPIFACSMAEALGMRRVVIPPMPGLFSSFGLLAAEVEHHYGRSFRRLIRTMDLAELNGAWDRLTADALAELASEGFAGAQTRIERFAALHYHGQTFELVVPAPSGPIDRHAVAHLEEAFGAEHERTYGHRAGPDEPVEIVAIQVIGRGLEQGPLLPERLVSSRADGTKLPPRQAYFGAKQGWLKTPVQRRTDLAKPMKGPCIVEEYDATTVVPPGATANLDGFGNILIELRVRRESPHPHPPPR